MRDRKTVISLTYASQQRNSFSMSNQQSALINPVSFFIVEDHPLTRQGLKTALVSMSPQIQFCGEASTVSEAQQELKRQTAQFVVIDHQLNGQSGLDLVSWAAHEFPQMKFMLVTQNEDADTLAQYQRLGVKVLISKTAVLESFTEAVLSLIADREYSCASISKVLQSPRQTHSLTPRELEVVRMIAQGMTNKEAAIHLECSEHTIKTHKTNVMRKLNLSNAVEISVWALKRSLA